ncbi:Maf family protein [Simiduia agarivorans]|uniref:7-methyl-GTP pyrophosphatase n=1 Tax=Simiduia agarivorans (strain DSM 21679 / JCM 13881 / BCRC 17597 / SA1) TaxID=1117647 RepID=H8YI02_SIMAS|nr:Maf family nucleotide pyrophosphatase [Simiduia agarivorans]AFD30852.1 Maf2 [Simiduia agarivorans SA1 = DSM 21679]AFU97945.1 maf protein [Simiduia agarivorans SA1 = DSM 21679]
MPNSTNPPLILASSSPYRRELLARLQLAFDCHSPDIDETPEPGETATALAGRLARTKAHATAKHYPYALIIGSDQVAECEGRLLGKPGDAATAREQLQFCRGKSVTFHTGLCLYNAHQQRFACQVVEYRVEFLPLSDEQIAYYIDAESPLDCAGSFKCEGLGTALFVRHQGSDPTALVGLPLIALCALLRAEGVDPLSANP